MKNRDYDEIIISLENKMRELAEKLKHHRLMSNHLIETYNSAIEDLNELSDIIENQEFALIDRDEEINHLQNEICDCEDIISLKDGVIDILSKCVEDIREF